MFNNQYSMLNTKAGQIITLTILFDHLHQASDLFIHDFTIVRNATSLHQIISPI